ncbi:hypothetical protein [Accumulibacter sp.]|uniref:hypothetical protein n=1 Tax=Accumulibacter sp. TaxID=2053492 RepID=UPI002613AE17|nr:hypothetical protein [Accumulibacter sp.]
MGWIDRLASGRERSGRAALSTGQVGGRSAVSALCRRLAAWPLLALPLVAAACAPQIDEQPGADTASFRPHSDAFLRCEVSESTYREVIGRWLRARPADAPPLRGLSLGRAFHFPWISRHLAESALRDGQWDARRGRPRHAGENRWVASTLSEPDFLVRLAIPFAGSPYAPVGVSVEKVLVGKAQEVAPDLAAGQRRLPFDAQIWLTIDSRR